MPDELRASDAEREAVVSRLARALSEGRITMSEFDERAQRAYAAKTRLELDILLTDLPANIW